MILVNDSQGRLVLESSNLSSEKDSNAPVVTSSQNLLMISPSAFCRAKTTYDFKRLSSHDSPTEVTCPLAQLHLKERSGHIEESDNEDEESGSISQNSSKDSPINLRKLMYEPKRISEPEQMTPKSKTPVPKSLRLNLFKVATGESADESREHLEPESRRVQPKDTPAFYFKQLSDIPELCSPDSRPTMLEFEVRTSSPEFAAESDHPASRSPASLTVLPEQVPDDQCTSSEPQVGGFTRFLEGLQ